MTRFFVTPDQIREGVATLGEDDAHHLRAVLHLNPGDAVAILDGCGSEWEAVLLTVGKKAATARLGRESHPATEPATKITVAQALPKMSEKMEQVLQRGTEIGVHAFRAFSSARSLSHLTGERHEKRLARWQAIVKTAAEQSHRSILPTALAEDAYEDILRLAPRFDLALLAYEREERLTLKAALRTAGAPSSILLIVGPESGITENEAAMAAAAGIVPVSLGPRILRTETAAMVAAAQILYELER